MPSPLILALTQAGYAIVPDFLNPTELADLAFESDTLRENGSFHSAGMGLAHQLDRRERQDEIHWLEPNALSVPQAALWARLELLRQEVDASLFLGLWSLEGHYSFYAPGGFYHRHRDSFRNESARTLSIVIYLNGPWLLEDGGVLRLFPKGEPVDVIPTGGTLVCFLSNELEHEVLPSIRVRKSFAGWFSRR